MDEQQQDERVEAEARDDLEPSERQAEQVVGGAADIVVTKHVDTASQKL